MSALPGKPGQTLARVWSELSDAQRDALLPHVIGGTSAEWLALELTNAGHRIGATSIKVYRRALREAGVQV